MTHLLDVNLLIALLDADHTHHVMARRWFEALKEPWATCPITETGVVRIMSSRSYPKGADSSGEVILMLQQLRHYGTYQFWADDLSVMDDRIFLADRMQHSSQVTDTYLLALSATRGGKLATFDARLNTATVRGGPEALVLLPS